MFAFSRFRGDICCCRRCQPHHHRSSYALHPVFPLLQTRRPLCLSSFIHAPLSLPIFINSALVSLLLQFVALLLSHMKKIRSEKLIVRFSDSVQLRTGPEPSLTRLPAQTLIFSERAGAVSTSLPRGSLVGSKESGAKKSGGPRRAAEVVDTAATFGDDGNFNVELSAGENRVRIWSTGVTTTTSLVRRRSLSFSHDDSTILSSNLC